MNLQNYYTSQCANGTIKSDPDQLTVLNQLELITTQLLQERQARTGLTRFLRKPKVVRGLYLWGGVGVGKTFLMDCFFHCLPFPEKLRMHFYQFMNQVHKDLKQLQGEKNPLTLIAKKIAKKTLLLCFDEFFVTDIVDAMLLGRLFQALFDQGVCIVTTSNIQPDDLYKNGLQRESFKPTIELIKQHTHVVHIPSTMDYRLYQLKNAQVFYTPHDERAEKEMTHLFNVLAHEYEVMTAPLTLFGREIAIKRQAHDIVWFDFQDICARPRSQQDYLALVERYRIIFISNIPIILASERDKISLFVRLVDVFYDARVRIVFSAAVEIDKIYTRGPLKFDYTRTCSRLLQMQSEDYFNATPNTQAK